MSLPAPRKICYDDESNRMKNAVRRAREETGEGSGCTAALQYLIGRNVSMRINVHLNRPARKQINFWNHIHFHPTDAI